MDALEELRQLRSRAYGPAADIEHDPRALQRLRELEGRESRAEAPAHLVAPVAQPAPTPEPEMVQNPAPAVTAEPSTPPRRERTGRKPAQRTRRRWLGAAWIVSVVAAAAVGAAITYGAVAITPVGTSHGARQIATLKPMTSTPAKIPAGWFGAGPSSRVYEFHGLTLFETSSGGFGGVAGDECFAAVATEQLPAPDADSSNWTLNGVMYSGCRVGAFPASIQIPVDSNAPDEMRATFPAGSALQFVLDGEAIGVFLDEG